MKAFWTSGIWNFRSIYDTNQALDIQFHFPMFWFCTCSTGAQSYSSIDHCESLAILFFLKSDPSLVYVLGNSALTFGTRQVLSDSCSSDSEDTETRSLTDKSYELSVGAANHITTIGMS